MEGAYLITGATGGVGQAVVKEFSENGKKMVLLGRDEEKLRKLKEETESVLTCISYNLEDIKNLETVFRDCLSQGIKFQGLVHCAGINQGMPIKINDIDVMDQMMRINLYSFVELGKYFTRKKYAFDESSIVAVSSMAAIGNAKGMCMYSATKAALNSTVKTMSRELISRKTRVNAIMPGYLEKPMTGEKDFFGEEEFKKIQPLGRIESQDVAKLASFLSSGAARFITGALIPIGGGQII